MNNKGFTLIELIAVVILLALLASIGAYSITSIIKRSREENYNILVNEIKEGAEVYYQECTYARNDAISCDNFANVKLITLVNYGYIKGNATDSSGKYILVNPINEDNIGNCQIKIEYDNGKVIVSSVTSGGSCPSY